MFGFPIGNGNAGFNDFVEKFTNNADSGFPKIQQREVFYSVKDGNWNDITIWQTASGRVGFFPTRNDDVYIKTNVLVPTGQSVEAGNIFVGGIIRTQGSLYCFGNFKCVGIFDGSLGGTLILFSNDNYINNFISGISNITYAGDLNQDVMPLNYYDLSFGIFYNSIIYGRIGIKKLISDLTISRNLNITYGRFEVLGYNLTVNGTTNYYGPGQGSEFTAAGSGYLLFIGELKVASAGSAIGWDFSGGNPSVECRGGIDLYNIAAGSIKTGTGTWYFTTNNQTIRSTATGGNITFSGPVVMSNVNLTVNPNQIVNLSNTINATNAGNKLTNSGTINFLTDTSVPSMTTGIFDFTTNANTIGYTGNYSATIPSYFTNFHNLTISGTGTKTLGVNTTLNGALTLNTTGGLLNCSTFNLNVTGVTNFQNGGLQKTGAGNLLFIGNFNSVTGYNTNKIDFSGNPNVELRGGITNGNYDWNGGWNTGTGTWTFTTNNQTFEGAAGYTMPCTCKFIVSGAISVTFTDGQQTTFADKIDGTIAGSTWINQGRMRFTGTEITPMATGVFNYLTSSLSYLMYEYAGTQTIPYTSYQGFGIAGVGFTKTLSGTTSVSQNFEFNSGTLECSTYNLSVTGNTTANGIISKTGAGNLLFIGNLLWGGTAGAGSGGGFALTGNPTLEFRGGITVGTYGMYSAFNTGTGTITFSTNNQTVVLGKSFGNTTYNNNIIISGAITVTMSYFSGSGSVFLAGSINGDNASSTLRIAASATTNYQNATQPMATGVLDTSTNLNTWIYGLNNQNIKGSPTTSPKQVYRNLTLNGTGVKTLQGYVSVLNTYTLTAPATLALNGFTLTNP